jgi:nucleotide-binding universal stress UspA family protein
LAGVQCSVEVGKPELKITEFARQSKASLIVMGARGLGAAAGVASHFVGGVTYDVACVATVPVLVVPHR